MIASSFLIGALLQVQAPSRLLGFTDFTKWEQLPNGFQTKVDPDLAWNEVVPSWNLWSPRSPLTVEIRLEDGKWYQLGKWSTNLESPSTSIKNQNTELAKVDTDTLIHKTTGGPVTVRLTGNGAPPDLKLFTLSFANRKAKNPSVSPYKQVDLLLEPPRRAQMSYPGGDAWCSPTATSMVLGYWAEKLSKKQLDLDVPIVAKSVFDPGWNGTGNWSFNTAFAGSQPGMRAYVARLWDVSQAEDWIRAQVPVICSVSYALLKGKEKKEPNDGHLVVLVGFTATGDPIFNDPGRNVVRMTYQREAFERAWQSSGRTTYLIYPKSWIVPNNDSQAWL